MAADIFRSWNVRAIVISRVFLATTLLLRTVDWMPRVTFYTELVFSLELLLGAAIAVGWLMRYAAALVFVGTLAVVSLPPHFRLAIFPLHSGTTVALLLASSILVCFGQNRTKAVQLSLTKTANPANTPVLSPRASRTWVSH